MSCEHVFDTEKTFTYLKGYIIGKGWKESLNALMFARRLHSTQKRKSGEPYIIHPITMASQAISMDLANDYLIAAILLHDVVEDCNVTLDEIPCCDEVKHIVSLVTYKKPENPELIEKVKNEYYKKISENPIACLVKVIDRCNNISTMSGVFTPDKLKSYIEETDTYILPLTRTLKEYYPEYQGQIFLLKYHIYSVLNSILALMPEK